MAKGYQGKVDRLEKISALGKAVGKRAGFKCEWCAGKEELRLWDAHPGAEPEMESLALLCQRCRAWAGGEKATGPELRPLRNALWSEVPAVAAGAARVLAQCRELWSREAIEESSIDERLKAELLK